MKNVLAALTVVVAASLTPTGYVQAATCGLDVDIKYEAPPPNTPDSIRRFLGRWGPGSWDGQLCTALFVWRVTPEGDATVTYVSGGNSRWQAWRFTARGKIVGSKLTINSHIGDIITYDLRSGNLYAEFDGTARKIGKATAKMHKTADGITSR